MRIPALVPRRRCTGAVEQLLRDLADSLAHATAADRLSRRAGLLQRLDPRSKLALCLLLVLAGVLTPSLATLAGLFATATLLALASGIGLARLGARAWLGVCVFTGLVALPAVFMVPGRPLAHLPLLGWPLSETGLRSAAFLLGRALTSATACLLLILTTPWPQVLKALRCLGVPVIVVALLGMVQRYIFVLLHTALQFCEARRSRLIAPPSRAQQRQMLAMSAGVLLEKSLQLSTEVHLAMISRGYRGEVQILDSFRTTWRDWLALAVALPLFALIAGGWL